MKCKKCNGYNTYLEKGNYKFHDVYICKSCNYYSCYPIDCCCRIPDDIVTIDRRDYDRYFLRYQCKNCYGCTSMTKPLKSSVFGDQIRAEFNMDGFKDWRSKKAEENAEIYEWTTSHNYQQTSYYKDYVCYLSSDKWKAKRDQCLTLK